MVKITVNIVKNDRKCNLLNGLIQYFFSSSSKKYESHTGSGDY